MNLLDSIPCAKIPIDLPSQIAGLDRVAGNLWWRRDRASQELFHSLDPELWERGVPATQLLMQSRVLSDRASAPGIADAAQDVVARFDSAIADLPAVTNERMQKRVLAYFCAEFGLQSRVAIYCGGLGILAGDHCNEASDLGMPFVGVGLMYRRGFFKQRLDRDGRQQHQEPIVDPELSGCKRVLDPDSGLPLVLNIELPGRTIEVGAWLLAAGRAPVLLLDADMPANSPEDRLITAQLYTVGRETRIFQEVILGVGGVRLLIKLGIAAESFHLNEGHSAFLLLERLREKVEGGVSWQDALEQVKSTSVLTIHTPVPDGNERFAAPIARDCMNAILGGSPIRSEAILKMGLDSKEDPSIFDMTAFALRTTHSANGVSLLHGETADHTWQETSKYKVIGVTNGVHMATWVGPELRSLFESAGAELQPLLSLETQPGKNERGRWGAASKLDDKALWDAHLAQKRRLAEFVTERLVRQHALFGEGPSELKSYEGALRADSLIIGFSRRFATYKRAGLIFSDEKRVSRLLGNKQRPVQIVFSGKAYPTDKAGQAMLAKLYQKSQSQRYKGKIFVVEDYDMAVAEKLVQGVDLWLNNPRRPMEASGTSGMKAAANGVPNASVLDGWWDEAYVAGEHRNGFAIGGQHVHESDADQDRDDAESLYQVLEREVIPTFFDRDVDGLPKAWIEIMKNSIADSLWAFSTRRMLEDYESLMYERS